MKKSSERNETMKEFVASNGIAVTDTDNGGLAVGERIAFQGGLSVARPHENKHLTGAETDALREFFQAEADALTDAGFRRSPEPQQVSTDEWEYGWLAGKRVRRRRRKVGPWERVPDTEGSGEK